MDQHPHNENTMENTPMREEVPSPDINLCVNGCGFFGNPQTANMCSKCYRDLVEKAKTADKQDVASEDMSAEQVAIEKSRCEVSIQKESEVATAVDVQDDEIMPPSASSTGACASSGAVSSSAPPPEEEIIVKKVQVHKNRCWTCNKKVGLLGHECRCEYIFCGNHRYAEDHDCSYDFKENGRKHLAEQNAHVIAPKIQKI